MNIVRVFSASYNSINQRLVKVLRFGKRDVQEAKEVSPHGIDSHPVKDMIALYAQTEKDGDTVLVGYLLRDKLAAIGETRLFATNSDGVLQNYIWLKNNGDIHFGDDADNLVRYSELAAAFNELKADFNALVADYNAHVHSGVTTGGGSSGPTPSQADPSTADITGAKIDELKTTES